jgi:transcriptional regulator GlxA family with amidase domain
VQSLDVTGPLEVFTAANRWCADRGAAPGYAIQTASLGGRAVRTSSGLGLLPDADLSPVGDPGPAHRPRRGGRPPPGPGPGRWLREHAGAATARATGNGTAHQAGLGLHRRVPARGGRAADGRTVTTHWERCAELAAQYPDVTVDPDPIFIKDGNLATSAGVTAGIDLALALVEDDLGRDAALTVARALVVFLRRPGSQSQFSAQLSAQLADRQPLREVQQWIAEHPAADLSVEASPAGQPVAPPVRPRLRRRDRHAARPVRRPGQAGGRAPPPGGHRRGVEQAARACGYGTPEAMRRAFVRALGVSPAEYRRRFRPKPGSRQAAPSNQAVEAESPPCQYRRTRNADRHPAL